MRADPTKACKVRVGVSMEEKREEEPDAADDDGAADDDDEDESVHTQICEGLFVMSQRKGPRFVYDVVNQTGMRFKVTMKFDDGCENVTLAGDPDATEVAVVSDAGTRTPAVTIVQVDDSKACAIRIGISAVVVGADEVV